MGEMGHRGHLGLSPQVVLAAPGAALIAHWLRALANRRLSAHGPPSAGGGGSPKRSEPARGWRTPSGWTPSGWGSSSAPSPRTTPTRSQPCPGTCSTGPLGRRYGKNSPNEIIIIGNCSKIKRKDVFLPLSNPLVDKRFVCAPSDDRGLERLYLRGPWFRQDACGPLMLAEAFTVPLWPAQAGAHLRSATPHALQLLDSCWAQLARKVLHTEISHGDTAHAGTALQASEAAAREGGRPASRAARLELTAGLPTPEPSSKPGGRGQPWSSGGVLLASVVVGVPLDGLQEALTVARTWGGAAASLGAAVVLCTRDPKVKPNLASKCLGLDARTSDSHQIKA